MTDLEKETSMPECPTCGGPTEQGPRADEVVCIENGHAFFIELITVDARG